MLQGFELVVVALATFGLVGYAIVDLLRRPAAEGRGRWLTLLVIGLVLWPVGWISAALYLWSRRAAPDLR